MFSRFPLTPKAPRPTAVKLSTGHTRVVGVRSVAWTTTGRFRELDCRIAPAGATETSADAGNTIPPRCTPDAHAAVLGPAGRQTNPLTPPPRGSRFSASEVRPDGGTGMKKNSIFETASLQRSHPVPPPPDSLTAFWGRNYSPPTAAAPSVHPRAQPRTRQQG